MATINLGDLEVEITPEQVGQLIWKMWDDEQAEMLNALYEAAGSEYALMMQFLSVRDKCKERKDKSLDCFQTMFASAFTIPFGNAA